jgi:hypothetical protein
LHFVKEFFFPFGHILSLLRSGLRGAYNFGYSVIHGATVFNTITRDKEKLAAVLASPAVMKVFALQCDLFSMGRICVKDQKGQEIDDDPFLSLIQMPNPFSNQSQFLWDFMFNLMMGSSYCYVDSSNVKPLGGRKNLLYHLQPSKIEWPAELERMKDKLIFSESELKALMKVTITYRYDDGTTFNFPLDRLVITHDLTNAIGNHFKGPSRLDALYKIISNAEHTLDSQNINIRYTAKFLVSGDEQMGTITKPGLTSDEKKDIVEKLEQPNKSVYPTRQNVNIRRFVENMANLQLSKELMDQYFLVGNMYGIPRDVLELYASSTYENQEKARAAHINYCLDPKGNQFMDAFEVHFGYNKQGRNICISWDHLPFMQIFENEKIQNKKTTVEVLHSLLNIGVSLDNANEFLGTNFELEPNAAGQQQQQNQQPEGGQSGAEGGDSSQTESDQEQPGNQEE